MMGPTAAAVLPALVLLAALVLGPLPLAVRGVLRPVLGPNQTRKWFRHTSFGVGTGMVAAVVFTGVTQPDLALGTAVLCLLALLAVIDWQWRWLPIEWTLGVIALALVFAIQSDDSLQVLLHMAIPALTLLACRQTLLGALKKEAMGLGDIWLIAGLGGFLALFQSFVLVGLAALSGLLELGARRVLRGQSMRERAVSYGTHLCLIFVIMRNFTPNW